MSILKLFGTWLPRTLCNILQEGIWTQDDFTYVLKPIFGDESTETSAKHPHVLIKFKDLKNTILPGEKISLKKSIVKSFQKDDVGRYLLSSWRKKRQQQQRQGKKFNFFPESAVTQLTAMKHFFTSLFSPNFLPETQTTTQYLIWHYGKIFIILPIMEWNQGSGWCRVESQTRRVWQWCATMMSWVQRWVELVVY